MELLLKYRPGIQSILLICLLLAATFYPNSGFGQSTAGITNIPDTSYTSHSAFEHDRKANPGISLVVSMDLPSVKEKKNIVYCSRGKRSLVLDVFYPKENSVNLRTAILIIHGGGWRSGNRAQHYPLAQKLASLGYTCFTPEYRLSTEALFPAAIHDIKAAIRWIRNNARDYGIDTAQLVSMGFSAGGEMAAFMGVTGNNPEFEGGDCHTNQPSHVNAVVDIDGTLAFIHPESGEGDDSKRTSAATYWFGYSKSENPALWNQASPLSHVGPQTPPTLFLNSSVARMHAGRDDYIGILNKYSIYTEVKEFDGAPHSFILYHPWFEPAVKSIDGFLKKVFASK